MTLAASCMRRRLAALQLETDLKVTECSKSPEQHAMPPNQAAANEAYTCSAVHADRDVIKQYSMRQSTSF